MKRDKIIGKGIPRVAKSQGRFRASGTLSITGLENIFSQNIFELLGGNKISNTPAVALTGRSGLQRKKHRKGSRLPI